MLAGNVKAGRWVTGALLASAVGLVAGCGGDPSEQSASAGDGATGATKVTLTQATDTLLWAPIYVAQEKGFFKQNGLNVKVVITGGASQAISAVLSGSADVAGGGLSDDLQLASSGKTLQAFATFVDGNPDDIVVTKDFAKKTGLTTASPLADKVKALKGATIGISSAGSLTEQIMDWLLPQYGLNPDKDIKLVPLHDPSTALTALQHDRVDGIVFPPPGPQAAVVAGSAEMWINTSAGEIKPGYWTGLLAQNAYVKSHPEVIDAMAKSVAQASQYIADHNAEAAQLIKHNFKSASDSAYEAAWKAQSLVFAKSIQVSRPQFDSVVSFLKGAGISVPPTVTFDKIATNDAATKVTGASQ
jgi:sulfonate transport system substrate-binding protein